MKAKKSLGQNFLKSKQAIRSMLRAGEVKAGETILEAGPGKGVLTEALLEIGAKVFAVEKDDLLIPLLQEKFSREIEAGKLALVHGDILTFDPSLEGPREANYKLIANIPYYITGIFLRTFLSAKHSPTKMVLLLQKEVAKRIVAKDKKESILSLSVKAYGSPKYIETVERKYFSPEPNVDSAILLIEDIGKTFFENIDEEIFFSVVKKAFSQKRKQLINNLDVPKEEAEKILALINIAPTSRAEDLTLTDFKKIAQLLAKK